jgi:hypothetical protein
MLAASKKSGKDPRQRLVDLPLPIVINVGVVKLRVKTDYVG